MSTEELPAVDLLPVSPAVAPLEPGRVGARYSALYTAASIALWMCFNVPIQVLIAGQLDALDPARKQVNLAIVLTVGGLVAIISNPLFGALSDATRFRHGRRRPWAVVGAIGGALSLLVLGSGTSVVMLAIGWGLCSLTLNILLAVLMAMVPDRVPSAQRGLISGLAGVAQVLGTVGGLALVQSITSGYFARYAALAAVLVVSVALMAIGIHDPAVPSAPRITRRRLARLYWVNPIEHPDFGWAWITRFLVILGFALGTTFQLYFLKDVLHYEQLFPGETAENGVFVLALAVGVMLLLTVIVAGVLSDRWQRRKAFVIASTVLIASSSLLIALLPSWPSAVISAGIMGAGFGVYLAVDVALVTEVLPSADDRGRDLGVINIANALPTLVAPPLCAVLVTHGGGYSTLYLVAGAVTLLGAVLVIPIRGVR